MANTAVLLKKSAIFVHRWTGVALCTVFMLWFASGIVMMYWSFPEVTAADRIAHSATIHPEQIKLSPEQAYATLHLSEPTATAQLSTFDGRPVYIFSTSGAGESMVYADNGAEQTAISDAMIDRIAARWASQPVELAKKVPVEEVDQWTVQGGVRFFQPLWKYSFPNGDQVYVSGATADVVQYTTAKSRFWAYLGAIPHWLYFTPLRKHQPQWSQIVIWSSGIGTVAALLGIVIGVWTYSPSKRYSNAAAPTAIPYRGQKRWHMIFGLIFGLSASTWAFSGMLSMDPFPTRMRERGNDSENVTQNIFRALRGSEQFRLTSYAAKSPRDAVAALGERFEVKELEFATFAGQNVYLASDGSGNSWIVPVQGEPVVQFDARRIIDLVAQAAGKNLAEARVMNEYDAYYLDRHGRLPLPVIYARLNDQGRTRFYIDPRTGSVVGNYNSRGWVNRWMYHGLHSLDFPWLYKHRPLWDIVVISLMLGGTALCVTSLILAWRVLSRNVPPLMPTRHATNQPVGREDLIVR